jgi:PadR family transcriptional regulator, regulatory protein PadR
MAILALHPNGYGVSIQDYIRRRADHEPSLGRLYAALGRLEDKGYIEARPGEATLERGWKRKLYVTVTPDGKKALAAIAK